MQINVCRILKSLENLDILTNTDAPDLLSYRVPLINCITSD